jgi:glycogen(starch) synthase
MKILMTADPIGGVWTYAVDLCGALQQLGCHIVLATLGAPLTSAQRADVGRLAHVDLRESTFLLEWMKAPWESLGEAAGWLLDLETETRPDVIHLNHLVHADLPWQAPVIVVGHSCVLSWWAAVRKGPAPEILSTYASRVRSSLCAADLVLAPTHAMMSALDALYGPLRHQRVIPNGRNASCLRAREKKEELIFCAGRLWDEAKNAQLLARIAPQLPWPTYVAGSTTSPDGHALELPGVRTLGSLTYDHLAQWYGRAAIYALPARYEPFGLTVLEAAMSGCALVLGDVSSLREVWGSNALYVQPDDPDECLSVLNELIRDPTRRARYATLARLHSMRYSPEAMAARYLSAYSFVTATATTVSSTSAHGSPLPQGENRWTQNARVSTSAHDRTLLRNPETPGVHWSPPEATVPLK